jgi:hypothetical protein
MSLNSTLRTALARLHVSDRDIPALPPSTPVLPDPIAGVLSVMAIFHRPCMANKTQSVDAKRTSTSASHLNTRLVDLVTHPAHKRAYRK